jgi:thiamine-monophosphate kinase
VASACIDVSDGLVADLEHILERSSAGAVLEADSLPGGIGLEDLPAEERWQFQLAGGDDYELCFTAAREQSGRIDAIARDCGLPITRIGSITAAPALAVRRGDGSSVELAAGGYQHFGAGS